MDIFVTVALVAVVFWAVALAAVHFAEALVNLLSPPTGTVQSNGYPLCATPNSATER